LTLRFIDINLDLTNILLMENIQLDYFIIRSFNDVKEFYSSLPTKSLFHGAGVLLQNEKQCRYNMLAVNESVYLFKEVGSANNFIFDTIHELERTFLKSEFFKKGRQYGQFNYSDFETDLEVEIKLYEYSNEKRLIINPLNKIDLLYSLHFHEEDGDQIKFDLKKYPSLENIIKMDKMMKKLNARVTNINTQKGSFT
jgi:hypothetical protein